MSRRKALASLANQLSPNTDASKLSDSELLSQCTQVSVLSVSESIKEYNLVKTFRDDAIEKLESLEQKGAEGAGSRAYDALETKVISLTISIDKLAAGIGRSQKLLLDTIKVSSQLKKDTAVVESLQSKLNSFSPASIQEDLRLGAAEDTDELSDRFSLEDS